MTDPNDAWAALVRDGFFSDFTYEAKRRYQKSSAVVPRNWNQWIVEVGCGTGRYHRLLKELGYTNIVSCDLTPEHIKRAREINPGGLFVVASGECLPFRDGAFDVLVSNAAIEHFASPARGVSEFARVTTEDATLAVTSDCYSWRIMQLLGLYRSKMPVDKTMTYGTFRALFRQQGLEIESADAWGITHYLRRLSRVSQFFANRVESAMCDDHWSNRVATSRIGMRVRMMLLDENLFVLRKDSRPVGLELDQASRTRMDLENVLVCPKCRNDLEKPSGGGGFRCLGCGTMFGIVNGIANFA